MLAVENLMMGDLLGSIMVHARVMIKCSRMDMCWYNGGIHIEFMSNNDDPKG